MISIIVPYRDREEHLKQFIPHMNKYLPEAGLFIVEQMDAKEFNRGKLLNIGVLNITSEHFALHDVDKLPIRGNYSYPLRPRQIAPNPHQTYSYFGGVTIFNRDDYKTVDGFNNNFWGWGGEDNELMFQLRYHNMRADWEFGEFIDLPHPRPEKEFDIAKWELAKQKRKPKMGLSDCTYELISKEVYDTHTHIKVAL